MRYRHKPTGSIVDAIQMWDAGEARFQVSPPMRWEHRDYLAVWIGMNQLTITVISREDMANDWEPIDSAKGGALPEGTYKVGDTHDTPHMDMLSTWVKFPKATPAESPVINLHVHIKDARDVEFTVRTVMETLRKEGVKL